MDNPAHLARFTDQSLEEIWKLYVTASVQCIRSRLFDFIAHPDLPKKFGHRPPGDPRRFHEPIINALAETGVAFEINTAGLRKPAKECYPNVSFLSLAAEAGLDLTINSDAHAPGEVGAGFETGIELARETGFTQALSFEKRRKSKVELA